MKKCMIPPHRIKSDIWDIIEKESNKKEINPVELTPERICDKLNSSNVDVSKVEEILEKFINDDDYSMEKKSIKLNVFVPQEKFNNFPRNYKPFFVTDNNGIYFFGFFLSILFLQYPSYFNYLVKDITEKTAVAYVEFGILYGLIATFIFGNIFKYIWNKLSESYTSLRQYKDVFKPIIILNIISLAIYFVFSKFTVLQITSTDILMIMSFSFLGGLGFFNAMNYIKDKKSASKKKM